MDDCVFFEIIGGSSPVSIVFQDETCVAFMDIQPINPGHVLVVPKEHSASLSELKPHIGAHLFKVAQRMAKAIRRSEVRCEGINIFMADGEVAGQEVFHVHLHVLPRYSGDDFGLQFGESYGERPSREELDAVAKDIGNSV